MEVREVTAGRARPERAERDEGQETEIKARSAELRKELSVRDLAFAQILFIVGLQWVGVAAKQGPSHVIFWLIAIALFYLPVGSGGGVAEPRDAARGRPVPVGEDRLQRRFRLHRGLEPLAVRHPQHDEHRAAVHAVPRLHFRTASGGRDGAKLGDRDRVGACHRRAGLDHHRRPACGEVGAHGRRRPDAVDLRDDHRAALDPCRERHASRVSPALRHCAGGHAPQPEPARQDGVRRVRRIRVRRDSRGRVPRSRCGASPGRRRSRRRSSCSCSSSARRRCWP